MWFILNDDVKSYDISNQILYRNKDITSLFLSSLFLHIFLILISYFLGIGAIV